MRPEPFDPGLQSPSPVQLALGGQMGSGAPRVEPASEPEPASLLEMGAVPPLPLIGPSGVLASTTSMCTSARSDMPW